MKPSSSRVSREVGISPRFTRFARADLSGASAGEAWIARGGRRVIPAARLGLRAPRRSALMPAVPHTFGPTPQRTSTPNHALQRTPGFGVQFTRAAVTRPAQSRPVLPAMKPGTARAFASRRRAHSRAPGPESLSFWSLGVLRALSFQS